MKPVYTLPPLLKYGILAILMIYALVRGWLAGMAAVLVEILLAALFFIPDLSPRSLSELSETSVIATFPLIIIAFIEEGIKCWSLRGISDEIKPFFRNAFFKGLLMGLGFASFEICLKILFHGQSTESAVSVGALSGGILHIATGGLLGIAWLPQFKSRTLLFPLAFFFLAVGLHIFYNATISPFLFERLP